MTKSMDDIMALCKRRGFVYQASEIYGGVNGFWDYGPLGAQLKKNLRDAWWNDVVMTGCNGRMGPNGKPVRIVPIDTCIIQNPKVWEASGHVGGFNDPMVDCKECKSRFRADHLWLVPFIRESDESAYRKWMRPSSDEARIAFWELAFHQHKLSPEEQKVLREDQEADNLENPQPFVILKTVVASSSSEALDAIEFTSKERKHNLIRLPDGLPPEPYIGPFDGHVNFDGPCPKCGARHSLTEPRAFNLMFSTTLGATGDAEKDKAYLRPETAQGIFINFKNVVDSTRVAVPFGIAQTGKSFRNEVTPRNFTFRSREFEQMEVEFFCHEDDSQGWYEFWRDFRMQWWKDLGLAGDNLIQREHEKDELSHYSTATSDIEYRFPFTAPGFGELEGVAHRGCYDLTQHEKHSKAKLKYFDPKRGELAKNGQPKGEHYLPTVIEPSAGLDRGVLAAICEAYTKDESRPSPEIMKFHPRLAPIKAAVFPLVNKDGMPEVADKLFADIRNRIGSSGFVETDAKQSIGKRYARMDEAGCPFCFTIDGETLTDQTVTVRDRDTGQQERIGLDKAADFLVEHLGL